MGPRAGSPCPVGSGVGVGGGSGGASPSPSAPSPNDKLAGTQPMKLSPNINVPKVRERFPFEVFMKFSC